MGILNEKDFIEIIPSLSEKAFKPGERAEADILDSHDFRYVESGEFKANLHVHTKYSDGTAEVEELLNCGEKIGKKSNGFILAITDHDTIDGIKEAYEIYNKKSFPHLDLCLGLEISTVGVDFPNQKKPVPIHLLVYGLNPYDEKLIEFLNDKRNKKLALAKETINELNKSLPYNFTLEEAAKVHGMVAKGQDEVAHPMKKYTSGKILLSHYFPNADFSYEKPVKAFKYLFKSGEPYHKIYKKALEKYTGCELPDIPDEIEKQIQKAREIYLKAHPTVGNKIDGFAYFDETVEFITTLESGVMSVAHPARSKAYTDEFYTYLFEHFKQYGKDKALFYEGYYRSYEGEYPARWLEKIDAAAQKFNLLKTGGLDSHGKDVITRCPYS